MPRRSTRVAQVVEDDIEVDDQEIVPSQQDSVQDVDMPMDVAEEEVIDKKPSRRSKKSSGKSGRETTTVKSEKSKKSRTRRDPSDERGDAEDGAEGRPFDREEFLATARPIPQECAQTVDGIISDLQIVLNELENAGFVLVEDTAVAVEEVSGNTEEGQEGAIKLDTVMRQLVDAQQELKAHQKSLDKLKQSIHNGEILGELEDRYTAKVDEAIANYQRRTTRQKYADHETYLHFRDRVWEVNHDDARPPMRDLISREDGDDSDGDSDIEVGGMTQDYKCPITLRPLTNPLTSKLCGHSYDGDAIREYINTGRGRNKCPATSCNQSLTLNDLETNEDLAKRAANVVRRTQRREEDSEESEAEVVD
ncbi:hypothetical protein K439DRAFT_1398662 [Ramaria rubella]|nr:hypothetical protein K439DRAFT_1398662 [Ramaria rubella]